MDWRSEQFSVAWSDCDAAGQVFYPNFYVWFDRSTEKLFKANKLSFSEMERDFGIVGMPLLETGAEYKNACQHDNELKIETWLREWDAKTFIVRHKISHHDGRAALSGFEKRIFVAAAPDRPAGVRAITPPAEIISRFAD